MVSQEKLTPSKTILTIVIGFLVLYVVVGFSWALWVAIAIGALGLVSSFMAKKIHNAWMGLAVVLGHIVPPVILSLIFFLILFPIALLSRIIGEKDPLQLKKTDKSLFKRVDREFTKDTFEKTW